MAAPINYTTSIVAEKTMTEMQTILGRNGADAVAVIYADGSPRGLTFTMRGSAFRLPIDVEAMRRLLVAEDRAGNLRGGGSKVARTSLAQAERVAWRVVKDWLNAQLALVNARMADLDEVMLPYLVVDGDRLLRDQWRDRQALTMGTDQ